MDITVLQESFAAGETSPLTHARYTAEGYQKGCKSLLNMLPDSRGPAVSRVGSRHLNSIPNALLSESAHPSRIVTFPVNDDFHYILILQEALIVALKSDGSNIGAEPEFITPWTSAESRAVRYVLTPDGRTMYFFNREKPPQKIVYTPGSDSFVFSAVAFTSPPAEWSLGSSYPTFGTYFEGRLWVSGASSAPQTIWASKSALPEDFTIGTLADDAFVIPIDQYGVIHWLQNTKNLLVGTDTTELIITNPSGDVLIPGETKVQQQSAYGTAAVEAVKVGDITMYLSSDRDKLRGMQYEWSKDNWLSTDLTYFSEHILNASAVKVVWHQNPDNLLWVLLSDGTVAVLAYDRGNNIYGWTRFDFGAQVNDIAVGRVNGVDQIAMVVDRGDEDTHIEIFNMDQETYMDAWVTKTGAFTVMDGLGHLEGQTVQIVGDGAVMPSQVVASGQVTLPYEVSEAFAGLAFDAEVQLLPFEKGSQTGASAPYSKNFHELWMHILNSGVPKVNGTRPPTRFPGTPMDTAQSPITGKVRIHLTDWRDETSITLVQDLPLPFTLVAISGSIAQEIL